MGTGVVAYDVTYAIQSVAGNHPVAVASRTLANARRFAGAFGISSVYDRYDDLIDDPEVDIVYIAVPNVLHADLIRKCAAKGKHVLCEKPMCVSLEEAQELRDLLQRSDIFCMEAMWTRFVPATERLLAIVKAGQLGQPRLVTGSFGHIIHKQYHNQPGEGVLADLGVYLIALCVSLFGKPDRTEGFCHENKDGVDEQASFLLQYDHGLTASFHCSYVATLDNTFSVHGTEGSATLCEPFYRSGFVETQLYPQDRTANDDSGSYRPERNPYKGAFKYLSFLKRVVKNKLINTSKAVPYAGNAYHYQVKEVNRCLARGLTESPLMPPDLTVDIMEVVNTLKETEYKTLK
ncbi:MAG: Gfo/Idh/MocA family oxidoreductase [Cyclobacteriaceae bacterium]